MALWTPSKLNLQCWLDVADADAVQRTGTAIDQLTDKSGNGYHATATGAARPTWEDAYWNGLPAAAFLNTAQWMAFSSAVQQTQKMQVFAVVDTVGLGAHYRLFLNRDAAGFGTNYPPACYFGAQNKSGRTLLFWALSEVVVHPTARYNKHIVEWRFDQGVQGGVRQDDGTEHTGSAPANGTISSWISINMDPAITTTQMSHFRLGELVITPGFLTPGDRQNLAGYFAHKWGLTGNLAAGHPYKNEPPYEAGAFWGTVRDKNGDLAGRTIYLVNEGIPELLGAYESDPVTGEYLIEVSGAGPFTLYFSGEPDRNAQVFSGVQPAEPPE